MKNKIMTVNFNLNEVIEFDKGQSLHELSDFENIKEILESNLGKELKQKFIKRLHKFKFKPDISEINLSITLDDNFRYLAVPLELGEFYKITGSQLVNYDREPIFNYVDDCGIIYCCFSSYMRFFNIIEIEKRTIKFYHLKNIDNKLFEKFTKEEKNKIERVLFENGLNYLDIFYLNKKLEAVKADANLTVFMTLLNMASIPITPFCHFNKDTPRCIFNDHKHNINYDFGGCCDEYYTFDSSLRFNFN